MGKKAPIVTKLQFNKMSVHFYLSKEDERKLVSGVNIELSLQGSRATHSFESCNQSNVLNCIQCKSSHKGQRKVLAPVVAKLQFHEVSAVSPPLSSH